MSTASSTALTAATLKLTPEQRNALSTLILMMEEFRKIDADMPLQQAVTLLTVALYPGTTVTSLAQQAGATLSSASRHVEALGPYRPAKKKGKDLLIDDYDAMDRRTKVIHLTSNGVRIVKTLLHYLTK